MKFVFDPEVIRTVGRSHLHLPMEEMLPAITQDLGQRYPGLIETEPEWLLSNAGGTMGQFTVLYASLREYVIVFGSPIGSGGHSGRYHFTEDFHVLLDGEMWYFKEGDLQREEYRPGAFVVLPKGESRGFRMVQRAWILEYARGSIPAMLPFGLADTLFSTLDFVTLYRTFRIYTKQVLRAARRRSRAARAKK